MGDGEKKIKRVRQQEKEGESERARGEKSIFRENIDLETHYKVLIHEPAFNMYKFKTTLDFISTNRQQDRRIVKYRLGTTKVSKKVFFLTVQP